MVVRTCKICENYFYNKSRTVNKPTWELYRWKTLPIPASSPTILNSVSLTEIVQKNSTKSKVLGKGSYVVHWDCVANQVVVTKWICTILSEGQLPYLETTSKWKKFLSARVKVLLFEVRLRCLLFVLILDIGILNHFTKGVPFPIH